MESSRHPDDVDLFVGVNHENHVPDGLVGPVSACIIGIQFEHLKYGDRHFYKHEGQFTPGKNMHYFPLKSHFDRVEQLSSIQKYSYQCFVCHTTDIEKVAANPFRPPNTQT